MHMVLQIKDLVILYYRKNIGSNWITNIVLHCKEIYGTFLFVTQALMYNLYNIKMMALLGSYQS